jgi:hypothetical protein
MEDLNDDSLMPFGKNKGKKLSDVSTGYLLKLFDVQKEKLPEGLKNYIEDRIPVLRFMKEKRQNQAENESESDSSEAS